jgi:hypothetical protein
VNLKFLLLLLLSLPYELLIFQKSPAFITHYFLIYINKKHIDNCAPYTICKEEAHTLHEKIEHN